MAEISTVKVKYKLGSITSNLDQVREEIQKAADEYRGIVITEDAVADGKKLLAALRKEKASLDDDRKKVKKAWMAPFEAWEKEAKQVIALYDEPEQALKEQLDNYELDRVAAKQETIRDIYTEVAGDLADYIPLNRIYNKKWENASYATDQIGDEIKSEVGLAKMMIGTVKGLRSRFEAYALEVLKDTGDLQKAIEKITSLEEQERIIDAMRNAEEARCNSGTDRAGEVTPETKPEPEGTTYLPFEEEVAEFDGFTPATTVSVEVEICEDDLGDLEAWVKSHNGKIKWIAEVSENDVPVA